MTKEYIVFSMGGAWYAFPILDIAFPIMSLKTAKSKRSGTHVQPLPRQSNFIKGLANVHGEFCVVLSIAAILGLAPDADDFEMADGVFFRDANGYVYGFPLENVPDIISISSDEMEPTPPSLGEEGGRLFDGVYQRPNGPLLGVLNPTLLVSAIRGQ
ncbi:MAG: chemotaxis protein CheW [Nitrospinae bacterium]|nr:chemotaxis protein CheW [Nitrospinota bacterium]